MKEVMLKKSWFEIEGKDHNLKSQCKRKFVAIIYTRAFQNDVPFS